MPLSFLEGLKYFLKIIFTSFTENQVSGAPPAESWSYLQLLWGYKGTAEELSGCSGDRMACEAENMYHVGLYRRSLPSPGLGRAANAAGPQTTL